MLLIIVYIYVYFVYLQKSRGLGFCFLRLGQKPSQAATVAWLGLAYLGSTWPCSGPCTTLLAIVLLSHYWIPCYIPLCFFSSIYQEICCGKSQRTPHTVWPVKVTRALDYSPGPLVCALPEHGLNHCILGQIHRALVWNDKVDQEQPIRPGQTSPDTNS